MRKIENNYAFIDSQNLNLGIRDLGWRLDYRKFRIYLREVYSVEKAFVFIGLVDSNKELYRNLERSGFNLVFKPITTQSGGIIKGNIDADLVLKTMIEYENFNAAVIVTSDGDFYSLVEYLYRTGKLKIVLSTDFKNCSKLLKQTAKEKIRFLDELSERLGYK